MQILIFAVIVALLFSGPIGWIILVILSPFVVAGMIAGWSLSTIASAIDSRWPNAWATFKLVCALTALGLLGTVCTAVMR